MPPAPVDLLLPAGLDGADALALLESRLRLDVGGARTRDRVLLDSFDGRLRAAGLAAERAAAKRGTATIELREAGAPVRRAQVAPARRHLTHELPEGAVRERLEPVLEERALLPMARVRSSVRSLAVLNGDEKSVVRLSIEAPVAILADGPRAAGHAAVGAARARLRRRLRAHARRAARRARPRGREALAL